MLPYVQLQSFYKYLILDHVFYVQTNVLTEKLGILMFSLTGTNI